MRHDIRHRPAYALAEVSLAAGEAVVAEGGAMVTMSGACRLETVKLKRAKAGVLGAIKQLLSGEWFLVNRITGPGAVTLAPTHAGDVVAHDLRGELVIQSGSFLACDPGVSIDGEWTGARSFFSGEGLFMLRASGAGTVLLNSFGAVEAVDVEGAYIVDTGHIVAFEPTLTYAVKAFGGGLWSAFTSGEGLVARFEGRGRLYVQTRNLGAFGKLIGPLLPPRDP